MLFTLSEEQKEKVSNILFILLIALGIIFYFFIESVTESSNVPVYRDEGEASEYEYRDF